MNKYFISILICIGNILFGQEITGNHEDLEYCKKSNMTLSEYINLQYCIYDNKVFNPYQESGGWEFFYNLGRYEGIKDIKDFLDK